MDQPCTYAPNNAKGKNIECCCARCFEKGFEKELSKTANSQQAIEEQIGADLGAQDVFPIHEPTANFPGQCEVMDFSNSLMQYGTGSESPSRTHTPLIDCSADDISDTETITFNARFEAPLEERLRIAFEEDPTCSSESFRAKMIELKEVMDQQKRDKELAKISPVGDSQNGFVSMDSIHASEDNTDAIPPAENPNGPYQIQSPASPQHSLANRTNFAGVQSPCRNIQDDALYCCTYCRCQKIFPSKYEWERHEKYVHWVQERFMCLECDVVIGDQARGFSCGFCFDPFDSSLAVKQHSLQCQDARVGCSSYIRRDKLLEHLRKRHGMEKASEEISTWVFEVASNWPRQCGFCGVIQTSWSQRANHVENHFLRGYKIKDWKIPFPKARKTRDQGIITKGPNDDDDDDDNDDGNPPSSRDGGRRTIITHIGADRQMAQGSRSGRTGTYTVDKERDQRRYEENCCISPENDVGSDAASAEIADAEELERSFSDLAISSNQKGLLYDQHLRITQPPDTLCLPNSGSVERYLCDEQRYEQILLGLGRMLDVSRSAYLHRKNVLQSNQDPKRKSTIESSNPFRGSKAQNVGSGSLSTLSASNLPLSDTLSRRSVVTSATSFSSAPPWHPQNLPRHLPTWDPHLTMAPFNYGYDLPCEFAFLGCAVHFHPESFEAWILHSISHFAKFPPPSYTVCIFCDDVSASFDGSVDPYSSWRNRMLHIGAHLQDLTPFSNARPDFWLIDYMHMRGLVSSEDYNFWTAYTERPHCDGLVPFGHETDQMKLKKAKGLQVCHDLEKELRLMKRRPRRGISEIVERTLHVYNNLLPTSVDLPDQAWGQSKELSLPPKSSHDIEGSYGDFERIFLNNPSQHNSRDSIKSNISDLSPESSRQSSTSRYSSSTFDKSTSTRATSVSRHGRLGGVKAMNERYYINAEDVSRRLTSTLNPNGLSSSSPLSPNDHKTESSRSMVIRNPLSTAPTVATKSMRVASKKPLVHLRSSSVDSRASCISGSIKDASLSGSYYGYSTSSSSTTIYRVPDDGMS